MKDIMLDLETLSTDSNAAIVSIGAVLFCADKLEILDKLYVTIDIQSSVDSGGTVSGSTLKFWLNQSNSARKSLFIDPVSIDEALDIFADFYKKSGSGRLWGNGSAFDNVILANAYRRSEKHKDQPWKFWNDMCYRTIKNMNPSVDFKRTGDHHNALDDAYSQTLHLIDIMRINKK